MTTRDLIYQLQHFDLDLRVVIENLNEETEAFTEIKTEREKSYLVIRPVKNSPINACDYCGELYIEDDLKYFKEERLILCPKCWTDYNLKKDHSNIKKQIKEWELKLDQLYKDLQVVYDNDFLGNIKVIQDKIEAISHEMMAINI